MRAALSIGLCLLVLAIVLTALERTGLGREARGGKGTAVSLVAAARGRMMPAPPYGTGPETLGNVLFVGDRSLSFRRDPQGLRTAVLSPRLELETHVLRDLAASEEDVAAFLADVAELPVGTVLVLGSSGPIMPDSDAARAALAAAAHALGSAVTPFAGGPVSWALISMRRPAGWVLLAEAFSHTEGVVAAFTLSPDLSIHDGYRGETLLVESRGETVLRLGEHLDAAVRSARVQFRQGLTVGGVSGPAITTSVPAAPRPDGTRHAFVRWRAVPLGSRAVFTASIGLRDGSWEFSDGAVFSLRIDGQTLYEEALGVDGPPPAAWVPWEVDLSRWAQSEVTLELRVEPHATSDGDRALWLDPTLRFELED